MKRKLTRSLTLILALLMIVTMLPAASAASTYQVVRGDSLAKIAQKCLGNASRWPEIYEANKDKLSDPNQIYVGQVLTIPDGAQTSTPAQTDTPAQTSTGTSSGGKTSVPTKGVFAQTTSGKILGYEWNGVECYTGIPYATAKRFEMPQKVESWDGIRPCVVYGEVSPQVKKTFNVLSVGDAGMEQVENEDTCLNLNVWTPDQNPSKLKPVLFWIHGGGFSSGSSSEYTFYTGRNLAEYGDIVFVSVNHRLNYVGYLDMSAYGEEFKYSGNAGQADLVAALEWVQENIANFGGDPNNVTIVGQSGGGTKVTSLLGTPSAKGLFHKAMIMSGGSVKTTRTTEQAQADTARVLEILGIAPEDAKQLQTISYSELAAACAQAKVNAGPVVDGDFYPTGTFEMSKDIPVMVGTTFGETGTNFNDLVRPTGGTGPMASEEAWRLSNVGLMTDEEVVAAYQKKYGSYADAIMTEFKKAYPDVKLGMGLWFTNRESGMMKGIGETANKYDEWGGTAYQYLTSYTWPMFSFGFTTRHTSGDVPLFFHNVDTFLLHAAGDEDNARKLSDTMSTALVNFLYTGNPSQPGLAWPKYTTADDGIMIFDNKCWVGYHHDDELLRLMTEAAAKK